MSRNSICSGALCTICQNNNNLAFSPSFIHRSVFVCILSVWLVLYRLIALLFIFHIHMNVKKKQPDPNCCRIFDMVFGRFNLFIYFSYFIPVQINWQAFQMHRYREKKNNNKCPENEPKSFFFCSFFFSSFVSWCAYMMVVFLFFLFDANR